MSDVSAGLDQGRQKPLRSAQSGLKIDFRSCSEENLVVIAVALVYRATRFSDESKLEMSDIGYYAVSSGELVWMANSGFCR